MPSLTAQRLLAAPFLIAATFVACAVLYLALLVVPAYIRGWRSPLNVLRGPKPTSFLRGNYTHVNEFEAMRMQEDWIDTYGHAMVVQAMFGKRKLLVIDPKALHHVLNHGTIFQRTQLAQEAFGKLLGKGLLFAEGPRHHRQRKVINPAFGPLQVRKFVDTFIEKSNELRDIWADLASKTTRKDGRVRVDAFTWMNKVTLDIIGLTGFDHEFNALHTTDDNPDKLYKTFNAMANAPRTPLMIIQMSVPFLRSLPFGPVYARQKATEYVREVGMKIVMDKKTAVLASSEGPIEKADFQNDLLSLLIKSNLASDLPDSMRMTDEEISGQVPTFLLAGHETTSVSVSWALFALACNKDIQNQLRKELLDFPNDSPSMEDLNNLQLLDRVLREVLRLYAPVPQVQRQVMEDTVIPLGTPIIDKKGILRTEIQVAKNDIVIVPIRIMNRSEEIWGEDAHEFRPERWEQVPEAALTLPTVYSNQLTFNAGPHACIGFRFSVAEAKAILFSILRAFEVELAIQPDDIVRRTQIVGRPVIGGNPIAKAQLPILIRPVKS